MSHQHKPTEETSTAWKHVFFPTHDHSNFIEIFSFNLCAKIIQITSSPQRSPDMLFWSREWNKPLKTQRRLDLIAETDGPLCHHRATARLGETTVRHTLLNKKCVYVPPWNVSFRCYYSLLLLGVRLATNLFCTDICFPPSSPWFTPASHFQPSVRWSSGVFIFTFSSSLSAIAPLSVLSVC